MTALSDPTAICDVAPRDGLQTLPRVFSLDERAALIDRLIEAGLRRIEVGSFVNPARVPQMADLEALLARLNKPADAWFAGLVMSSRGVERALSTSLDEVRLVLVATESFSLRNQGVTPFEMVHLIADAAPRLRSSGKRVTVVIAAAFGCPFEGAVSQAQITTLAGQAIDAGAEEIVFADTIGCAVPNQVVSLAEWARGQALPFGFHFHDTRGTGLANAWAAVTAGASVLDAATAGIGGCPFAPGATGNIATEDLVWMLRQSGYDTRLDLDALIETAAWLDGLSPGSGASRLARARPFPEAAAASRSSSPRSAA
ncbi:MAG: hydroxymethylglutaryl-CoA lyase [Pseudomonadota bacterium]